MTKEGGASEIGRGGVISIKTRKKKRGRGNDYLSPQRLSKSRSGKGENLEEED